MTTINQQVIKEMQELKKLGVSIPVKAFKLATQDLSEYDNLSVSRIVDLLRDLA